MDVIAEEVKEVPPWNLMFADDMALCGKRREEVEKRTEDWQQVMEERGNVEAEGHIKLQDYTLKKMQSFKYLGSVPGVRFDNRVMVRQPRQFLAQNCV